MFSDIAPLTGGRKKCKALVEAYEAAWAQSQGDQPGFPKTDEEKTFQRVLIDWHLFHESMLIGNASIRDSGTAKVDRHFGPRRSSGANDAMI
jgi:hypothetical protein